MKVSKWLGERSVVIVCSSITSSRTKRSMQSISNGGKQEVERERSVNAESEAPAAGSVLQC